MGNIATSCAPSIISTGVVKVLLPDGTFQIYAKPVKAAELMVENPGQFVCESNSLKVGQRIQALSANEELRRRQLYFLLPMDLLYSVLTEEEMTHLTYKTTKGSLLKLNNLGKIFPVFSEFCIFTSSVNTPITCSIDQPTVSVESYNKQRSWKPALETIVETPSRPL